MGAAIQSDPPWLKHVPNLPKLTKAERDAIAAQVYPEIIDIPRFMWKEDEEE